MQRPALSALLACSVLALPACSSAPTAPDAPAAVETSATAPESAAPASDSFPQTLAALAEGAHRAEGNAARNAWRHPVETLGFFGLEPTMTVLELNPGNGWYTEILAPALAPEGRYIAAWGDLAQAQGYMVELITKFEKKLADAPEHYGKVGRAWLHPGHRIALGEPGSVDLAVTFRNLHGWHNRGQLAEVLKATHEVLKPGGILGVVQHRATEGADLPEASKAGYLPETFVIETISAHGFELVDKSEINANPKDTKDHPEGVWTLPPTYRLGEVDRAKYEAIGESDRMTLKFRKVGG